MLPFFQMLQLFKVAVLLSETYTSLVELLKELEDGMGIYSDG